MADAPADPFFGALPGTAAARIGSYVGVPVLLGDGAMFGTLCGVDPAPRVRSEDETEEEVALLRVLARVVAFHMEAAERARLEGALLAARTAQHEANNRLVGAVGYAELLRNNPRLPEALRPLAEEARAAAAEAALVLQQLADIVRLETTEWGPNAEPTIDLNRSGPEASAG